LLSSKLKWYNCETPFVPTKIPWLEKLRDVRFN